MLCVCKQHHTWGMLEICMYVLHHRISHATKPVFCRDKSMKNFSSFATNICRDRHNFVMTSLLLSRQTRVCRDKTRLLSRRKYASRDKNILRRVLSRQTNTDIGTGDKATHNLTHVTRRKNTASSPPPEFSPVLELNDAHPALPY